MTVQEFVINLSHIYICGIGIGIIMASALWVVAIVIYKIKFILKQR